MSTHSHQITKDLYLVQQDLNTNNPTPAKPTVQATNHFAVIDCSGSMAYDLPKIREQLKRRLPKLLGEKDTFSIIWFSGRGQFGTLLEAEPIATLADLKAVEQAIDRWLKPTGLTGFTEPLEEAGRLVQRVSQKTKGSVNSLMFLSDGCDNQGSRAGVLKAMETAAGGFQSTTIIEYGYYADRNLLSAMAERAGGALLFSEDFDRYAPTFEAVVQKRPTGAPRVDAKIEGDPVGGFAFALLDGDLITYSVESGNVRVPKDLQQIFFLSPTRTGVLLDSLTDLAKAASVGSLPQTGRPVLSAAYAAASLFATRMKSNIVYPILKALGDVSLILQFGNCFGKQRYSEFQETTKLAAFDGTKRFIDGYDPTKVPADDAFTVLDLLNLLASDDNNRVLLDSKDFKYSPIGRGRVDASERLTPEEQAEIATLTAELSATKKASRVKEITARISEITANKPAPLKFVAEEAPNGYSVSALVFNEDRPNVSFMIRKSGTVDVSERLAKAPEMGKVATTIETHIFRNYTVIKDGLINIDQLPVNLTNATYQGVIARLGSADLAEKVFTPGTVNGDTVSTIINLRALPVINRNMIKDVTAKQFFQLQYDLLVAQAEQKVYNSYAKELLTKEQSEGLKEKHGETYAAWLKEQGITDGGFSPKGNVAEATDFYMGKELKVSVKGYSSLPTLKVAKEQITKNKFNGPGALMAPTVKLVEDFLNSDLYKKSQGNSKTLEVWLEGQTKAAKTRARQLIYQIAQTTFSIVVGQIWFQEFSSLDENTLTIEPVPGTKLECKAELKEIEIKI